VHLSYGRASTARFTPKAGPIHLAHVSTHDLAAVRNRRAVFVLSMATTIWIGWHTFFQTGLLAIENDEYTQILLVLPVSVSLLCLELRSSWTKNAWGFRLGTPLLALAVLIALYMHVILRWAPQDVCLAGQMLALVLSWIGIVALCFGVEASRFAAFPLLLLFALVPFPQSILNPIIAVLQEGSAWSAHALFAACGIPVIQSGVQVAIPGVTIQVAQECSSIRSSSMLLVTAIILAQFFLRTFWRKALVTAIAVPLSIAKNGLRIFIIAVLGTRVDPGFLTGRLHRQGGILFFVIALALVFAAIWIFRRGEGGTRALTWDEGALPEAGVNR
jgi:exosortase